MNAWKSARSMASFASSISGKNPMHQFIIKAMVKALKPVLKDSQASGRNPQKVLG